MSRLWRLIDVAVVCRIVVGIVPVFALRAGSEGLARLPVVERLLVMRSGCRSMVFVTNPITLLCQSVGWDIPSGCHPGCAHRVIEVSE